LTTEIVSPFVLNGTDGIPKGVGAKAANLAKLAENGFRVPKTLFIPQLAYEKFIHHTQLIKDIEKLVGDNLDSLRWEELWESSLYLRNSFLRHPIPSEIASPIMESITKFMGDTPLAIRSCAPEEDSGYSHAGMHESVLHVAGEQEILKSIRLVWASLWSDRSILYRREMGLDSSSTMGVIVQPMVAGKVSGVMFTQSPTNDATFVIEATLGAASEVVEDAVDTQRIEYARTTGKIVSHKTGKHDSMGTSLSEAVYATGREIEELFGNAQDIEWTATGREITILQSRSITTLASSANAEGWKEEDVRPWYLSLTRSHENLLKLKSTIEDEILPSMARESETLKTKSLEGLNCQALLRELEERKERLSFWRDTYWRELIPFAHAVRQFGMLYNDAVAPNDPFEFTALLTGQNLIAVERNQLLLELSEIVNSDTALAASLREGVIPENGLYTEKLSEFMTHFGDLTCSTSWCEEGPWGIVRMTLDAAGVKPKKHSATLAEELEQQYLSAFPIARRSFAESVLDLARTSYRLRDDDNIYLGKIQARYEEVKQQAVRCGLTETDAEVEVRTSMPKGHKWTQEGTGKNRTGQFMGWAAAAGIARGTARVVNSPNDLFQFRKGEIMVCDALDPNMTFVVPLLSAIVERRGGMLVHGAIIAREYGIPCVTGIANATTLFQNGDELTVDGFRGVVERADSLHNHSQTQALNVLGEPLQQCCERPMTGFFRSGVCDTETRDLGKHVVCAIVTDAFLEYSRAQGNDLITPQPNMSFPGLIEGDKWCLCSSRWEEAHKAGVAPPVILQSTHEDALKYISLETLTAYSLK
jgi:pyruvate,water dikinase